MSASRCSSLCFLLFSQAWEAWQVVSLQVPCRRHPSGEGVFPRICDLKAPRRKVWLVLLQKRQNNTPPPFFCFSVKVKTESQDPSSSWRSLIPVIKVNVSTVSKKALIRKIFISICLKRHLPFIFLTLSIWGFCLPSCFKKVKITPSAHPWHSHKSYWCHWKYSYVLTFGKYSCLRLVMISRISPSD